MKQQPIPMGPGRRGPRGPVVKARDQKKTALRLLSYMKDYKFRIFFVIICIFISAVTGVISSMFLKTLIDDYVTPLLTQSSPDFSGLLGALMRLGAVCIAGAVCTWTYNMLMIGISQGILKRIRCDLFRHMQTLPIKYFDTHLNGDTMSRFTNDTDTLRQVLSQTIPQVISSVITIVSVLVSMLSLSIPLTLVVLSVVVLMMFLAKKIGGNSAKYFVRQQKSLGAVNGYIEEMINGQKVVKVFCYENDAKKRFDKLNDELFGDAYSANKFANILMPVMGNLGHMQYVLLAVAGSALAVAGVPNLTLTGVSTLTVGVIASFLLFSRSFNQPISQMSNQLNAVAMAIAGAERIFDVMDEKSEEDNGYVTLVNAERNEVGELCETEKRTGIWAWRHPHEDGSITYTPVCGDVRFFDVDFGYVEDKIVLHNIDLFAEPGQKVAFVGATGAGKTTITNLINRFYDIADGKIRYDGININKIKKSDLRRSLGVILQDVNLFTGTVMENIRYGKLDATDQEVYAAAKLAGAHDFITMLPDGYDTLLTGDGSGLSQGQRQLLSIARAAVADPPVMIMDEATSSIDTRTEAIVQRGMDSLMKDRTVFVIAHRLSTVQNSHVIMVLEHGRIIERGTHEQLIEQKGKYYQLYTGVFELE